MGSLLSHGDSFAHIDSQVRERVRNKSLVESLSLSPAAATIALWRMREYRGSYLDENLDHLLLMASGGEGKGHRRQSNAHREE